LRNEYLATENRILRARIKTRLLLSDTEKATLAAICRRLDGKAIEEVAAAAGPDMILGWYPKLIAQKFGGSRSRQSCGRPSIDEEAEGFVVWMVKETRSWLHDRIVGALANLGLRVSAQTVGNIPHRHGVPPVLQAAASAFGVRLSRSCGLRSRRGGRRDQQDDSRSADEFFSALRRSIYPMSFGKMKSGRGKICARRGLSEATGRLQTVKSCNYENGQPPHCLDHGSECGENDLNNLWISSR
jgi:hypothetical protein